MKTQRHKDRREKMVRGARANWAIAAQGIGFFALWALSGAAQSPNGDDGLAGSWRPGPRPALTVASTPGLNLKKGFSIETRICPTDLSDGRNIVFKDKEYALRIDWPVEGSRISFYVYGDGQWEPRVSAYLPATNQWRHIVAAWDGHKSYLWVDGEPFSVAREAGTPAATDNPVCIGSAVPLGAAFAGEIEYVRIYRKMLPPADILGHAYGIKPQAQAPGAPITDFDFSKGLQHNVGQASSLPLEFGHFWLSFSWTRPRARDRSGAEWNRSASRAARSRAMIWRRCAH
jgi:hypothetical protein